MEGKEGGKENIAKEQMSSGKHERNRKKSRIKRVGRREAEDDEDEEMEAEMYRRSERKR